MSDIRAGRQPAEASGKRSIRLAPMTRAVRSALAVSTIALALGAGGNAFAATCDSSPGNAIVCGQSAIDLAPVVDLTVVAAADPAISAGLSLMPLAIVDTGPGDVSIVNADSIEEIDPYYGVVAIQGYSPDGNVDIVNQEGGDLVVASGWGNAIGIYGHAAGGDVTVDNAGSISAGSVYGIADGIFAAGTNVDVSNSGSIETYSYYWTAGIEAESTDATVVRNSGDINVAAGEFYLTYDGFANYIGGALGGHAIGIYAVGGEGGIDVDNSGSIYASGAYVAGVDVVAIGDIAIDNSGSISTGPAPYRAVDYSTNIYGIVTLTGSLFADGIAATSLGDGTNIAISNSGDIAVTSMYGANGITATAGGYGSTVDITNSGNISASQYMKYGYGAYGIVATADSDATVDNTGTITVDSTGAATGVAALSFAGNVSVTNSGDVDVLSASISTYSAAGLLAFAANGIAYVNNSGNVSVSAYTDGSRVIDAQGYAGVTVVNSGSLYTDGKYGYGIYAVSFGGDVNVLNTEDGEITFDARNGSTAGMFGASANGDIQLHNAGTIEGRGNGQATGILGIALQNDVTAVNSGTIDVATAQDAALGIFVRANFGTATVVNSGDIHVSTFENSDYIEKFGYMAYGVLAQGDTVSVANSGNITAQADGYAAGIAASAIGDVVVTSSGGDIMVESPGALLLYSYYVPPGGGGGGGGGGYYGGGYYAQHANALPLDRTRNPLRMNAYEGGYDGGYYGGEYGHWYYFTVLVGSATGINAKSAAGDAIVSNASDITVDSYLVDATGIKARAFEDAYVSNSGDISVSTVYGFADGILVQDYYSYANGVPAGPGTLSVVNSGDISVAALAPGMGRGSGITVMRERGDVSIENSGVIDIYAGGRSYGLYARTKYGDAQVVNTGDITMLSEHDAQIGIQVATGSFFAGGGDVLVLNSGDISVRSDYGFANAIGAIAGSAMQPYGNSYIRNSGTIDVLGQYNAAGIQTRASKGDATIINSGDISVETRALLYAYLPDQTVGIAALSFQGGDLTIQNAGDVDVRGYAHSYGLYVKSSAGGNLAIHNSGDVHAHSKLAQLGDPGPWGYYAVPAIAARAVYAYGLYGDLVVNNTGSLVASGGDAAIGVHALTASGSITVNNAGSIHAGNSSAAAGVLLGNYVLQPYGAEDWTEGTSTLNNSGSISVDGDEGSAFAVIGGWAADTINNSGVITGAISLYAANDTFNNLAGGVLDLTGRTLDMGDGNDKVVNAAGGTILLGNGTIVMGGGDNAFTNSGTIVVNGDSLIDMGGDTPAAAVGAAGFQTGLFQPMAVSTPFQVAAALSSGPLVNSGTISFANGFAGDMLTIAGDLGGTGQIRIDADLAGGTVDQLHVEGDIAAGTVQTVHVAFTGIPAPGAAPLQFVVVDGSAASGSFVGGQAIGFSPRDFLDLDVVISSVAGSGGTVFSAGIGVAGLNDAGALASNIASGAAGFINSQMGTFRQRLGVNPYGGEDKLLSAFFRTYRDEGDMSPTHTASNFGQGGSFDFRQTVSGSEVGINANVFGDLHAGIVLGNADARQRLTGDGVGESRMDGMTIGAYATWYVPQGFYVDLAGRKMTADVEMKSAANAMGTRVDMSAASIEAGYQWSIGQVALVPQVQYTRTEVEGIRALAGEHVDFQSHGGSYSSGRLGLEASMTFEAGAARITPYGSLNAIRMFDGESTYTVTGGYTGSTTITGTSTLAELGLGVQAGAFGFGIGANWTDGGALDGFFGGQASIRYSW